MITIATASNRDKKLCYAIYFFESIFDDSNNIKALSYYKTISNVFQKSLGALNDIAVIKSY